MDDQYLEIDKVINVWLDEIDDVGIVEMENHTLGTVFNPICRDEVWSNDKYVIIDFAWYPNYQGARRKIENIIKGRLSKRDIDILKL